jgi:carotenoid 1,2-hydratase
MSNPDIQASGELRADPRAAEAGDSRDLAIGFQPALSWDGGGAVRPGISRLAGLVQTAGVPQPRAGLVSDGGQRSSRSGRADGSDLRTPGGSSPHRGLRFDHPVSPNGYAWWYLDALSDDGAYGITAIAFLGSVFSPYYAWARRRGDVEAVNHCSINIAVYSPRAGRWAMTERGASIRWTGEALEITVNETCTPVPRSLRGLIRLTPRALFEESFALDAAGLHHWTPHAPWGRVDVHFSQPALNWSGVGYLDSNTGEEPLERAFAHWTWSRSHLNSSSIVLYDTVPRHSPPRSLALQLAANGGLRSIDAPPEVCLPHTRWRLPRRTRADTEHGVHVVSTLEDTPFYSRSLLSTRLLGDQTMALHEGLSLDRFRSRWVQCLLPFRMPRITF